MRACSSRKSFSASPPRGTTTSALRASATRAASSSCEAATAIAASRGRPLASRPSCTASSSAALVAPRGPRAAQDRHVAALQAQRGDVDGDVRPRLVDHQHAAQRHPHAGRRRGRCRAASRRRPRRTGRAAPRSRAAASASASMRGLVERQPVEQRRARGRRRDPARGRAGWPRESRRRRARDGVGDRVQRRVLRSRAELRERPLRGAPADREIVSDSSHRASVRHDPSGWASAIRAEKPAPSAGARRVIQTRMKRARAGLAKAICCRVFVISRGGAATSQPSSASGGAAQRGRVDRGGEARAPACAGRRPRHLRALRQGEHEPDAALRQHRVGAIRLGLPEGGGVAVDRLLRLVVVLGAVAGRRVERQRRLHLERPCRRGSVAAWSCPSSVSVVVCARRRGRGRRRARPRRWSSPSDAAGQRQQQRDATDRDAERQHRRPAQRRRRSRGRWRAPGRAPTRDGSAAAVLEVHRRRRHVLPRRQLAEVASGRRRRARRTRRSAGSASASSRSAAATSGTRVGRRRAARRIWRSPVRTWRRPAVGRRATSRAARRSAPAGRAAGRARESPIGGGSSRTWRAATSAKPEPRNGGRPASISYSTTPSA